MRIATLSIGDELLYGETVDTNAPHIAASLIDLGLPVARHMTVGDDIDDIVAALLLLADGHAAVIVTGGLGPTSDDVTARAAAKAAGRRMVVNEEALAHLRACLDHRGDSLHPLNEKQALLPAKAELIPNPVGTACGFSLRIGAALVLFLPGVPREMTRMLEDSVLPRLIAEFPQRQGVVTRTLRLFGPEEAEIAALIQHLNLPAGVTIAYCVAYPEILVKVRGTGKDESLLLESVEEMTVRVSRELEEYLVSSSGDSMENTVAELFQLKGATVALAESCTGGLLAKRVTDVAGSSAYFLEGVVTYADAAKERLLGVPADLLAAHGAVSREVAMAMARGVRSRAGSDLGLAITGIAGPGGGSPEKPVGTVYLALADRSGCQAKGYLFPGNRKQIRTMSAHTALDWLRRKLLTME